MDSGARGRSGRRIRARCGNTFGSGSLTGGAGKGLNASASFSGLGGNNAVIPSVSFHTHLCIAALYSTDMPVLRFIMQPIFDIAMVNHTEGFIPANLTAYGQLPVRGLGRGNNNFRF